MIFELSEEHYEYVRSRRFEIVGESNIGDTLLVKAYSVEVDYIASYENEELDDLLNEEPYVKADEDIE